MLNMRIANALGPRVPKNNFGIRLQNSSSLLSRVNTNSMQALWVRQVLYFLGHTSK